MASRKRRFFSRKVELLHKLQEAAISAVQIYNNPSVSFKSELYIVTMIIAWTYLLHAYYRGINVDYRYFEIHGSRKRYDKTKQGAYKYWELERCLNDNDCPLAPVVKTNLSFLIGLRHEIEHQMTTNIDDSISAKLQACCLNFNSTIKSLFGEEYGLDKQLSFSLQFSSITEEQITTLRKNRDLPRNIQGYITDFEDKLSEDEIRSAGYAFRVLFVPILAKREGQADEVIEYIKSDSEMAGNINKSYTVLKETEKQKYLPSQVVELMKKEGYTWFSMSYHTNPWQDLDAKDPKKNYGTWVAGKYWHWYENWVSVVRNYCKRKDF
jgi:hypothetical protein